MKYCRARYEILKSIAVDESSNPFYLIRHYRIPVKIICDRHTANELKNYNLFAAILNDGLELTNTDELVFILPYFFDPENYDDVSKKGCIIRRKSCWFSSCLTAEKNYLELITDGATPLEACRVLPDSIKTEVFMNGSCYEWREFLKFNAARKNGPAHPQVEEIMQQLLCELNDKMPGIFDDIYEEYCEIMKED